MSLIAHTAPDILWGRAVEPLRAAHRGTRAGAARARALRHRAWQKIELGFGFPCDERREGRIRSEWRRKHLLETANSATPPSGAGASTPSYPTPYHTPYPTHPRRVTTHGEICRPQVGRHVWCQIWRQIPSLERLSKRDPPWSIGRDGISARVSAVRRISAVRRDRISAVHHAGEQSVALERQRI